VYIVK
jgi:hypothetical protein